MTTTQLVTYLKAHSYPAWSDDNETIHVVVPWVRRGGDGKVITGHNVARRPGPAARGAEPDRLLRRRQHSSEP